VKTPKISLCVPTYNRGLFIADTIRSVLKQTESDFELIILNDASPDSTEEIVKQFDDERIRYFKNETNVGVPENYNRVFSLATSELVCLLEDHDLLDPDYLAKILPLFDKYSNIAFAFSGIDLIDQQGKITNRFLHPFQEIVSGQKMLRRLLVRLTCPCSLTTVIRRSMLENFDPPFSSHYWWYADIPLWMTLCSKGDVGYIREPLLKMREREDEHFLNDKLWESQLCLDKIHKDHWKLLHKGFSLEYCIDRIVFEFAKIWNVLRYRANKLFYSRQKWSREDKVGTRKFIHLSGRVLVASLAMFPVSWGECISAKYVTWWKSRHESDSYEVEGK